MYKLISYSKNLIIIENLTDKKRTPAYSHDKIISLGDIAIYTSTEEVPLKDVLNTIYEKFEGKVIDPKAYATPDALRAFFIDILPDFDQERVYNNDIKKIISWYNILVNAGYTDFSEEEKQEEKEAEK